MESIIQRYVLEAVDPATASIAHEVGFKIKDIAELCAVLDLPTEAFNPKLSYPLDLSAFLKLKRYYNLVFDDQGLEVWLRPQSPQ